CRAAPTKAPRSPTCSPVTLRRPRSAPSWATTCPTCRRWRSPGSPQPPPTPPSRRGPPPTSSPSGPAAPAVCGSWWTGSSPPAVSRRSNPTVEPEATLARRPVRAILLAHLDRLLTGLVGRLDRPGAQSAGSALGAVGWHLARRDRRRTLDHLAIAFPDRGTSDRAALGRASFRHFGTMLGECL